jgi:hypothetical protein
MTLEELVAQQAEIMEKIVSVPHGGIDAVDPFGIGLVSILKINF